MMTEYRSFTLVEMLVVMIVMVALATVAVQTSSRFVDQSRYEGTERALDVIEEAILGVSGFSAGYESVPIRGFVADMGRLPEAVDVDGDLTLQELWENTTGMPAFSVKQAASDSAVVLAWGWRGPYVNLPLGDEALKDKWGDLFELRDAAGVSVAAGDEVALIQSTGAAEEVYQEGLAVLISDTSDSLHRHQSQVTVTVSAGSTGALGSAQVILYYPGDTQPQELTASASYGVPTGFTNRVPRGRRVIRAYHPNRASFIAGSPGTFASEAVTIDLLQAQEFISLELLP